MISSGRKRSVSASLLSERLEPRLVLSGNVAAYVRCGVLMVWGDDQGVDITISQEAPGHMTVTGTGTTINRLFESVTFDGITRNLFVRLGKGNDRLTIDETKPISIRGDVNIIGGGGSDVISTITAPDSAFVIGGNMRVLGLSGRNDSTFASLASLDVKGDLQVRVTGQAASVEIGTRDETSSASRVGGNLVVRNDATDYSSVSLLGVVTAGDVRVSNQGGVSSTVVVDASIGKDARLTGNGSQVDTIQIEGTHLGRDIIASSSGVLGGSFILSGCTVAGRVAFTGGAGADTVILNGVQCDGTVSIDTKGGDDGVSLGTSVLHVVERMVPEDRVRAVHDPRTGVTKEVPYMVLRPVFELRLSEGAPVRFGSRVIVNLGYGADSLDCGLDATVTFMMAAAFDGQGNQNFAAVNWGNVIGTPKLKAFAVTTA